MTMFGAWNYVRTAGGLRQVNIRPSVGGVSQCQPMRSESQST